MPDEDQSIHLRSLRNIQQLTMRVYRTKLTGDTELNPDDSKDYSIIRKGLTELKDYARTLNFQAHAADESFEDSLILKGLSAGIYLIEFSSPQTSSPSRTLCFVSGLRVMTQPMPNETMRYVVVDARTGQPVPRAVLRMSYYTGRETPGKLEKHTCNEAGELLFKVNNRRPISVYASTAADNYCPSINNYGRYTYYERQYNQERINLFTDRSLYRPGQTVYVTAIAWKELSAIAQESICNKSLRMILRDANYKVVAEQDVTTDRFGKCTTQFTLPTGLLNGRFTIRVNSASVSFNVEEYKRPAFKVEFTPYKQSYQAGDTLHVQGKALTYAGVPVQNAKVHYVVKRRVAYWWLSYSRYWNSGYTGRGLNETVLSEGETMTTDDGVFCVDMPMVLPEDLGGSPMFYHFVVDTDVTDVAGESHQGSLALPLGTSPTALKCDIPKQLRRDQLPLITFTRCNAAGNEIAGLVRYRLDGGSWKTCNANEQCELLSSKMKSGEHFLEAVCEKDTIDIKFIVFSLDDKKPVTTTKDWFYASHQSFPNDGSPVTVQVGSSDPDLHIVYGLYAGNNVIESGTMHLNKELANRQFTYQESYGNGLLLTYAWVKDGQCYMHQHTISRPMPDKQLKLTWETFRDRLTPGQQEEWRLKILQPDGQPADASLMAVLYDKSLDQLKTHQWTFTPSSYISLPNTRWQYRSWGSLYWADAYKYKLVNIPAFSYNHLDSEVYPYYQYNMHMMRMRNDFTGARLAMTTMANSKATAVVNDDADGAVMMPKETISSENLAAAEEFAAAGDDVIVDAPIQQEMIPVRENLRETAFCYPALETDQQGGVVLSFTLPESLTTWRFMGVAHTADMFYGTIEGETVAKKTVMIQPNVPRFVRVGDEVQITARVFNTSEKTVSGQAKLQLTDASNNALVAEQQQPVNLEAGKTASVTFTVSATSLSESLLICKVFVSGEGFSDGEQHYLPVLSDMEYVTKSIPYTQNNPGVKTIDLTSIFPQGTTQQKLTLEYTNNPVWLMVQALPVIGQPNENNAIDQAAAYYSNLLAKTLMDQSPQVKNVFLQWQKEQTGEQTLQSQLQKNEELKELLLNETPWVVDANQETEQKQHLADFFDDNRMNNRLVTTLQKLQKLQNTDGSFSWYPGMDGNLSVTMAVQEMLVRLNQIIGQQAETLELTDGAYDYLSREMTELVAEMKKQEKKGIKQQFPSFNALRWLYLCALEKRQMSVEVRAANDYLVKLLNKEIKRQSIYEKALTAIIFAKRGEMKKAKTFVQSIKEYTVYTEEMGRYYDTQRATYSWYDYKIPTEVAAIEAIQRVTPQDSQTINEMRRWLLQEKRTQAWDTPINTVNAIYAFLNQQSHLLTQQTETVLALDGNPIQLPHATAGVGYVKISMDNPQASTFTASKSSSGTSWGAVYAQYLERTSAVQASQSGIVIQREILNANGQPVEAPLSVGDKIRVRITITSSRDLDFVQVVDHRAACMEPLRQLSGYQKGAYVSPKDAAMHYFYGGMSKGKHVIETDYYIDRAGIYETGICTVLCSYAPEYRATAPSVKLIAK